MGTFIGLHRQGCRVRLCCMPNCPYIEQMQREGITVVPILFRKRIDREAIRKIRAELATERYDVLHLLHNRPISNGLIAVRGFDQVKVVVYRGMVGNVSFLSPTSWMRYLSPRIDRVICVADAVRQYFVDMRFLGLRLDPDKFVTIHKGHSLDWYKETPLDLRQFGIPEGAFVVGLVANMRPRKGIDILVQAFALLPKDLPIYLILAGHMQDEVLDRLLAKNPNAQRILRIGYHAKAPALIAACQVAVLPSVKREGLPKNIIEAMAGGVAPIVTDVGGSPELVEPGVSGLVVPASDAGALAEAVLTLYRDPALCRSMGAAARRRLATDFNIDDTVEKTLTLYRELVGREFTTPQRVEGAAR
jgi:glycosyltransferase involved in cell wall biosynthesis